MSVIHENYCVVCKAVFQRCFRVVITVRSKSLLMPNTHRRRRRDSTVRVGVASASAVCIEFATSSRRLPTTADENLETEHVENLSCRLESS